MDTDDELDVLSEEDLQEPSLTIAVEHAADTFTPFEHQKQAWNHLDRHFLQDQKKAGFVVVPTGGGKTDIAARWLIERHIKSGGRVLWFVRRT